MQMKVVEFDLSTRAIADIDPKAWGGPSSESQKIYWIHLDRKEPESIRRVAALAKLDEAALAAVLTPAGLPGMVEGEDDLTLHLEWWTPSFGAEGRDPEKFALYMTSRFVITAAAAEIPPIAEFDRTHRREFRFAQTTGFMLFLILDDLVDRFVTMLGPLDLESEKISDRIHGEFDAKINREILYLKHRVLVMKRVVTATRDILMRLSGRRIPVVSEPCRESLQAIFDHSSVLVASVDSLHDMIASALDSYMSVLAQRMNETMKVLTVFSAIVMPMTLVAGIYGMNFDQMPELRHPLGYPAALSSMAIVGVGLWIFFRRKKWI